MISEIPDYKRYSIEQLIDARDHVDKTAYPDRYELIINEIANRNIPVEQVTENANENANAKKIETQFGLVVIRLPLMSLIIVKLVAIGIVYYCSAKFYQGFVLQEVTVRGNLLELSDSPVGYYLRMMLYGFFSLYSLWIISFGTKLKQ